MRNKFSNISTDCIEKILSFVSFEIFLYFYPKKAIKDYDPTRHSFLWCLQIREDALRHYSLIWLMKHHVPIDSFDFFKCAVHGDLFLFRRLCLYFMSNHRQSLLVLYTRKIVDTFCRYGKLELLDWWFHFCKQRFLIFRFSQDAIDFASQNEYIEILNWWEMQFVKKEIPELKYSKNAIDKCFSLEILNWWLHMFSKYGFPLKYSTRAIDSTFDYKLLNWWLNAQENFNLKMKYSKWAIINACIYNEIPLLSWWFCKIRKFYPHIPLKYDETALDYACSKGNLEVLKWFYDNLNGISRLHYSSDAIDKASENGHLQILEWWGDQQKNLVFKFTHKAIDRACRNGHIHILNWWFYKFHIQYGNTLLYSVDAIEDALQRDREDVIRWWANIARIHNFRFF